ncbi:unnamed protein product, partial [Prorocentrum cordatum]
MAAEPAATPAAELPCSAMPCWPLMQLGGSRPSSPPGARAGRGAVAEVVLAERAEAGSAVLKVQALSGSAVSGSLLPGDVLVLGRGAVAERASVLSVRARGTVHLDGGLASSHPAGEPVASLGLLELQDGLLLLPGRGGGSNHAHGPWDAPALLQGQLREAEGLLAIRDMELLSLQRRLAAAPAELPASLAVSPAPLPVATHAPDWAARAAQLEEEAEQKRSQLAELRREELRLEGELRDRLWEGAGALQDMLEAARIVGGTLRSAVSSASAATAAVGGSGLSRPSPGGEGVLEAARLGGEVQQGAVMSAAAAGGPGPWPPEGGGGLLEAAQVAFGALRGGVPSAHAAAAASCGDPSPAASTGEGPSTAGSFGGPWPWPAAEQQPAAPGLQEPPPGPAGGVPEPESWPRFGGELEQPRPSPGVSALSAALAAPPSARPLLQDSRQAPATFPQPRPAAIAGEKASGGDVSAAPAWPSNGTSGGPSIGQLPPVSLVPAGGVSAEMVVPNARMVSSSVQGTDASEAPASPPLPIPVAVAAKMASGRDVVAAPAWPSSVSKGGPSNGHVPILPPIAAGGISQHTVEPIPEMTNTEVQGTDASAAPATLPLPQPVAVAAETAFGSGVVAAPAWPSHGHDQSTGVRAHRIYRVGLRKVDWSLADTSRWHFRRMELGAPPASANGDLARRVVGPISEGLEKFRSMPWRFQCIVFESDASLLPAHQQSYTLLERRGAAGPPSVVDVPGGRLSLICALYAALSPEPALLPDGHTDRLCRQGFRGEVLGAMRPGRGEGCADVPSIGVARAVNPSAVACGAVGDLWLLSGLAALASFSGAVRRLFRGTPDLDDLPRQGSNHYTVSLYDLSTWQPVEIVVDERVCCRGDGSLLGCPPGSTGDLWACYVEKAVACHCGGWDQIDRAGHCTHAWCLLTGCRDQRVFVSDQGGHFTSWSALHPESISLATNAPQGFGTDWLWRAPWPVVGGGGDSSLELGPDEMFERMRAWEDANYIVACSAEATRALPEDRPTAESVLLLAASDAALARPGPACSVLACVSNSGGTGVDLVQVRDPWGVVVAARRRRSNEASADGACQSGAEADDGVFWLEKEDFFEIFTTIYLCVENMAEFVGEGLSAEPTPQPKAPQCGPSPGLVSSPWTEQAQEAPVGPAAPARAHSTAAAEPAAADPLSWSLASQEAPVGPAAPARAHSTAAAEPAAADPLSWSLASQEAPVGPAAPARAHSTAAAGPAAADPLSWSLASQDTDARAYVSKLEASLQSRIHRSESLVGPAAAPPKLAQAEAPAPLAAWGAPAVAVARPVAPAASPPLRAGAVAVGTAVAAAGPW